MFFGLTNSPATFQTMIKKLLQVLINMGEVAKFIDDVIVGTDEEEGHDEVVEEVVRRLAENDLYVKGVLEWLTLEGVKDIQKFLKLASYYQ